MRLFTLNDIKKPLKPQSLDEWLSLREELLKSLRFASSIDLLKHDEPLKPLIFGAVEREGFVIEKVIFQSLPGFYVAGNLYRPKDTSKKYPAVLNPHGHWKHGRLETDTLGRLPQRCANLALRGMVAFIYDMVGYNDSNQIQHEGRLDGFDDWSYGHFSLQLNNSIKALDFVSALPYVDSERIGVTGCSGGGTQTWFLAALDDRIKAAAPINMVSAYMQGGCSCENAPFLRTRFCSVDYAAVIAPRPMFLAASDGDWTKHSQEVEFPAVKNIYSLYGAEDRLETFYQSAPHCYNRPSRERAYDFFCRVFGLENPFSGEIDMEITPEELLIGDIREHVDKEGFIEGEEQLFELVKGIMTENLKKLSSDECDEIIRRVFPKMTYDALDIPYVIEDRGEPKSVWLGACPEKYDTCEVKHLHAYNYGFDTRRVCAIRALMEEYPEREFVAKGKTAYLTKIAAKLCGHQLLKLEDAEETKVDIPGFELVKRLPEAVV